MFCTARENSGSDNGRSNSRRSKVLSLESNWSQVSRGPRSLEASNCMLYCPTWRRPPGGGPNCVKLEDSLLTWFPRSELILEGGNCSNYLNSSRANPHDVGGLKIEVSSRKLEEPINPDHSTAFAVDICVSSVKQWMYIGSAAILLFLFVSKRMKHTATWHNRCVVRARVAVYYGEHVGVFLLFCDSGNRWTYITPKNENLGIQKVRNSWNLTSGELFKSTFLWLLLSISLT